MRRTEDLNGDSVPQYGTEPMSRVSNPQAFRRLAQVPCGVCGAHADAPVLRLGSKVFPVNVSLCRACGFLFLSPRPDANELDRYYREGIYDRFQRPRGAEDAPPDLEAGRLVKARMAPYMEESSPEPEVWEVGAGNGDVVRAFEGWRRRVVEPSPECRMRLAGLGIEASPTFPQSVPGAEGTADLVVLRQVLEHVADPLTHLESCAALLRERGRMYLSVPHVFGPDFVGQFAFHHVSYFSRDTLALLCGRAGLSVLHMDVSGDELWCVARKQGDGTWDPGAEDERTTRSRETSEAAVRAHFGMGPTLQRRLRRLASTLLPETWVWRYHEARRG